MIVKHFQQPRVFRSSPSARPKDTVTRDVMEPAGSGQSDQAHVDEQRSLDAAVSEGWPISLRRTRGTDPRRRLPNRTGDQFHRRPSTITESSTMGIPIATADSPREGALGRTRSA